MSELRSDELFGRDLFCGLDNFDAFNPNGRDRKPSPVEDEQDEPSGGQDLSRD